MSTPAQIPVSKISTTLLRAVFDHLCSDEPVYLPLQPSEPRFVLSLVCKKWCNTVQSTYSLWANVHFTKPLPNTAADEPKALLRQFGYCTMRSGRHPLNITFDMVCNGWAFSIVRFIIIPHIHRIKMLSCPIYNNHDIITFLTIPEGSFSVLESVEIWFINTLSEPASSFPLHVCLQFGTFRTAPRLRKAAMHLSNGLHPIDLRLPWGQLTTLDLETTAMPPNVFIKIMYYAAQRLESAFFKIRFTKLLNPHLVLWRRSVKMQALKNLRLLLLFPSQDTRLFSLLRLPSLETLWLEMHDQFQDWDIPSYTKLLQASTKSLRQLHLIDYPRPGSADESDSGFVVRRRHRDEINHHILDKFFTVISNIQNLHLPVGLDIHEATVEKISTCALLPQLYTLELGSVSGWPILFMARRRHARWLHASLTEPNFEIGQSQRVIGPLRVINLLIPHRGCMEEEKAALIEEARALEVLDITCYIQTTLFLPLPIVTLSRTTGLVT